MAMDSIKKKMLAMKMEKENALDKSEQLEQKLRDTEEAKAKVEEDLTALQKKHQNLENEFDVVNEKHQEAVTKLEAAEKRVNEEDEPSLSGSELSQEILEAERSGMSGEFPNSVLPDQDYLELPCAELSQESQSSTIQDGNAENVHSEESKTKKKSGKKKVKKKKVKKAEDGEKSENNAEKPKKRIKKKSSKTDKSGNDKNVREKSSASRRPEPEGGNSTTPVYMNEYDKIIYSNEPIFSDLEMSDGESAPDLQQKRYQSRRGGRPVGIYTPCGLGINSGTLMKLAIIENELKNILRVTLKRVGLSFLFCSGMYLQKYSLEISLNSLQCYSPTSPCDGDGFVPFMHETKLLYERN